ncbi:hypothetical protein ACOSQ3_010906 [Xanthoceras sorbifolium]
MMNVIPLDNFEMVLDNEFSVEAKGKKASSVGMEYNEALERGKCVATLESKSGVGAESVRFVDELQTSMALSRGPVEFQRKLGDCSKLGREPKQQIKHKGCVTVGQI